MPRTYLVRHAKAGDRYKFPGPDRERPLSPAGRRQSVELAEVVTRAEPPERVWTSPALRCVQSVEPVAAKVGVPLEVADWLDEGSDVLGAFGRLAQAGGVVVACTHGDVIWGVLEILARAGIDLGDRPDAQKGSVWVLDWTLTGSEVSGVPERALYIPPASKPVAAAAKRRSR